MSPADGLRDGIGYEDLRRRAGGFDRRPEKLCLVAQVLDRHPVLLRDDGLPDGEAFFTVTAEDSFRPGCFVSASVVVEVVKSPAPTLTAPSVVFASQAGLTASVPAHEGSLYEWSIFNGTITAGEGTKSITFTAGPGPIRINDLFEVGMGLEVIEFPSGACRSEKAQASILFATGSPPPAPTPTPAPTPAPTPRTRTVPFRS